MIPRAHHNWNGLGSSDLLILCDGQPHGVGMAPRSLCGTRPPKIRRRKSFDTTYPLQLMLLRDPHELPYALESLINATATANAKKWLPLVLVRKSVTSQGMRSLPRPSGCQRTLPLRAHSRPARHNMQILTCRVLVRTYARPCPAPKPCKE